MLRVQKRHCLDIFLINSFELWINMTKQHRQNFVFFTVFFLFFCFRSRSLSLSLSLSRGLKSPNSYEIAYVKYRESLYDMKNDHIAQH